MDQQPYARLQQISDADRISVTLQVDYSNSQNNDKAGNAQRSRGNHAALEDIPKCCKVMVEMLLTAMDSIEHTVTPEPF